MPITAKLSRQFYEKLGDEVTNELVTWLNAVDQSYRQEFRDLFEANFGQVRAELAQLRAELKAELKGEIGSLRAEVKTDLVRLEQHLAGEAAQLRVDFTRDLHETKSSLIRWMLGFWIGAVFAIIGGLAALRQLHL